MKRSSIVVVPRGTRAASAQRRLLVALVGVLPLLGLSANVASASATGGAGVEVLAGGVGRGLATDLKLDLKTIERWGDGFVGVSDPSGACHSPAVRRILWRIDASGVATPLDELPCFGSLESGPFTISSLTVTSDGRLMASDPPTNQVWEWVFETSTWVVRVGSGAIADPEHGVNALTTPLKSIKEITSDGQGRLLISDHTGVHRLKADGTLEPFGSWASAFAPAPGGAYVVMSDGIYRRTSATSSTKVTNRTLNGTRPFEVPITEPGVSAGAVSVTPWSRIETAADGTLLVQDEEVLLRLRPDGSVIRLTSPFYGGGGEGTPATAARLQGSFVGRADGSVDVAVFDGNWSHIWRIDQRGLLRRLAGQYPHLPYGDGAPADAQVRPQLIDHDPASGDIWFTDSGFLRRLGADGVRTVITPHQLGVGGRIEGGLAVVPDGDVIFTVWEAPQARLYRWDRSSGSVTLVAGGGWRADNGTMLATEAALDRGIGAIAVAGDTNVAFTSSGKVHLLDLQRGVLSVLVAPGDGSSVQLDDPLNTGLQIDTALAFGPDGLYFHAQGRGLYRLGSCGRIEALVPLSGSGATPTIDVDAAGKVFVSTATSISFLAPSADSLQPLDSAAGLTGSRFAQPSRDIVVTPDGDLVVGSGTRLEVIRDSTSGVRRSPSQVLCGDGTFHPVVPARILDTRLGLGAQAQRVPAAGVVRLPVAGRGGLPSTGISAVVLNVTAVEPSTSTYITVWPSGADRPVASSLNAAPGAHATPNLVTMPVGRDGMVMLYNDAGSVDLVADVLGWYAAADGPVGDRFTAREPLRVMDTRLETRGALAAGETRTVQLAGGVQWIPAEATAVLLNVTVTEPTATGYVTAYPHGVVRPLASNLNFSPGETVPNAVVVKVDDSGFVDLFNSAGRTHLVVDVMGWYSPTGESTLLSLTPARLWDSRSDGGPLGPGETARLYPLGDDRALEAVEGVVLNATGITPSARTWLTLFPGNHPPHTSNVNLGPSTYARANHAVVGMGDDGGFEVYNDDGSTHVALDVVGFFIRES